MSKLRVLLIGVVVTFASFVPAASAAAGLATNHSETLLLDA